MYVHFFVSLGLVTEGMHCVTDVHLSKPIGVADFVPMPPLIPFDVRNIFPPPPKRPRLSAFVANGPGSYRVDFHGNDLFEKFQRSDLSCTCPPARRLLDRFFDL